MHTVPQKNGNMIIVNEELKNKIINDVDVLANPVRTTLGPCGANVIINSKFETKITKDGVSVARAIKKEQNSPVINIIQQVSENTGTEAGDGTTSSTVFSQALIHSIYKQINADTNLIEVKRYLDEYKKQAVSILKDLTTDSNDLRSIANISSNNDQEISDLVVEVVGKTGKNGMVTLKDSETTSTHVSYTEGLKWNTGYMSPNFITNQVRMECEFTNVRVEIYDDKLTSLKPIIGVMDTCAANGIPMLLAVKDIEYDVLNTIVYNSISGKLKICVVKIPGHSSYRTDNIDDLKAIIGNREIIDKVLVTKNVTLFVNNSGNEETKKLRIANLEHRLTLNDENISDLQNRITNINNGYATVYVGGDSQIEIKEKIDRFEDALCAVKSAMEEGVVIGGGNTLRMIGNRLDAPSSNIQEWTIAYNAVKQACTSVIEQLMANNQGILDYEYGTLDVPEGIIAYKDGKLEIIDNPIERGLIDPAKVIRMVIENGISVAGTLITTKCLILNEENDYGQN